MGQQEMFFVNNLVPNYLTTDDSKYSKIMRDLIFEKFRLYLTDNNGRALEIGCEIGYLTEKISKCVGSVDIVDASLEFLSKTKERDITNAFYFHSLIEDFTSERIYDFIFANHILEHLFDVPLVLKKIGCLLNNRGYFFVTVPNARALSRQLAMHMGLIKSLYDLTPNDLRGGHRRVYDILSLREELLSANFKIVAIGGILFKLLADFQMDKLLEEGILQNEQIDGLYSLGEQYPDFCGDIYAICQRN